MNDETKAGSYQGDGKMNDDDEGKCERCGMNPIGGYPPLCDGCHEELEPVESSSPQVTPEKK